MGDIKSAKEYANKEKELQRNFDLNRLKLASRLYELENQKTENIFSRTYFIYGAGCSIVVFLILLYQYRKFLKHKGRDRIEVDTIRNKIQRTTSLLDINEDTEQRILQTLQKFEEKEIFLEKGYSALKLASFAGTNVRYMTEVIKKHKAENFNSYVNSLRINYIIDKLKTDCQYRKYKISYLADIGGFSSPAIFTKIFSSIKGVTPSEYLRKIHDDNQNSLQINS